MTWKCLHSIIQNVFKRFAGDQQWHSNKNMYKPTPTFNIHVNFHALNFTDGKYIVQYTDINPSSWAGSIPVSMGKNSGEHCKHGFSVSGDMDNWNCFPFLHRFLELQSQVRSSLPRILKIRANLTNLKVWFMLICFLNYF